MKLARQPNVSAAHDSGAVEASVPRLLSA